VNKYVIAALLCALPGMAGQPSSGNPDTIMAGAYVPVSPEIPIVQEARTFIQKHLASLQLGTPLEACSQIVAGVNIKFICVVTDEDGPADWQFVAYRSLDANWHFISAQTL
jgi:hypothetical protein